MPYLPLEMGERFKFDFAGTFALKIRASRLLAGLFLEDMGDLRIARRAVDVNPIAGVDHPVVNDPGLFETVEGFAKLLPEAAQRSVGAAAACADGGDAGRKILGMATGRAAERNRKVT